MRRTLEVADLEDRSPGLRRCTLKLRTVNLDEALPLKVFAEEASDGTL